MHRALRVALAGEVRDRHFGNARYIRNQFEAAVVRQAWRLRDVADPTVEQLQTIEPDDIPQLVASTEESRPR
jgi:hypothetical protein